MAEQSRVNFNVEPELKERIDKLPWGTRSAVFRKMSEFVCDLYDKHGEIGVGIILSGKFHIAADQHSLDIPNRDGHEEEK